MRGIKFIILLVLGFVSALNAGEGLKVDKRLHASNGVVINDFSADKFPLSGVHKKLNLTCNDCHKESEPAQYSSAMLSSCLNCHNSYAALASATGALGHNDNIHASPHYAALACDNCHRSHRKSENMCVRCHTQDSLKSLIVK
ncbi:cytochrome c3 family protein [Campylobacter sp. 19-13652]|uniref:cytochrome c3 family protein n=1 Tax=Campylobacter sp. 19-13652 TaxID=2840180 RepID=UPI001C74FC6A|nr:cytochrome c3 family protein [Campylobacter sp. 19-13652]BCX78583.1 hypothetical protein LBC_00450 [Campylobacter sp. 19-13652]